LTTRFCEIRFPKPAPDKAFGGIKIKKITPDPPGTQERLFRRMLSDLYFDGEIHTKNRTA